MLDILAWACYARKCKTSLTFQETEHGMKNIIEQKRRERGLTQQQLAAALGVSRQTIISLEGGKYNPSILLAHSIARLFDARIEDIFIFEEEEA